MILSGVTVGSTTLTGQSDPTCPCTSHPCDGKIHVFDCGPDGICHDGDDFEIAVPVSKNPDGTFAIMLTTPLKPGQIIYATDGCFDPVLMSPDIVVRLLSAAPALSPRSILMLAGALCAAGLVGLRRLHRQGIRK